MRGHKHHKKTSSNKRHRRLQERVSDIRERSIQEQVERDARITEEYGEVGHNACGRKLRYPTKSSALVRASKCARHGAPALRPYHCKYCGGWHLTSKM